MAFDDVKRQLFDRLHGILRAQLFPVDASGEGQAETPKGNGLSSLQGNGVPPPSVPKP